MSFQNVYFFNLSVLRVRIRRGLHIHINFSCNGSITVPADRINILDHRRSNKVQEGEYQQTDECQMYYLPATRTILFPLYNFKNMNLC